MGCENETRREERLKKVARLSQRLMRRFIAPCLALFGCAQPAPPARLDPVQAAVHKCGMDGQMTLKKEGAGEYSIQHMAENADSKGFICVLNDLQSRGIKVGFVSQPKL